MAESCIFCDIIDGKIPAYIIHENENFIAFLDLAQFTQGHTIAVPKKHFDYVWDVNDISGYFSFVQDIGNHYRNLGYKYVDTMTFGRMVRHSHVHIVPHNGEDQDWKKALEIVGSYQQDPSRRLSKEQGQKLVEKFSF